MSEDANILHGFVHDSRSDSVLRYNDGNSQCSHQLNTRKDSLATGAIDLIVFPPALPQKTNVYVFPLLFVSDSIVLCPVFHRAYFAFQKKMSEKNKQKCAYWV